ncbi:MAG: TraB/GumN family protein [Saprospiraceae bacterium]|nr:TraB/GumN family protein [Saprospiraceae bacterium]
MKNTLLWRLTPPHGGSDSYLFGTMHVRDQRAFGWLDLALIGLKLSDVFAAEFDLGEADERALAQVLQLPEGKTLDQLLSRQAWKKLQRRLGKTNPLPISMLQMMHPMVVSMTLSTQMLGEEANFSLDETLWRRALEEDKKTTGVESFEDQLNTLRSISIEQHISNLSYTLEHLKKQKKRVKKMLKFYASGDIKALYRTARRDTKGMRKVLLYRRNCNMANRFAEIATEQSLFCAVGAGHLAGKKGMLRLLKQQGFKLHPILPA